MKDKYYQVILGKYRNKERDFDGLFQAILSVADEIGLEKARIFYEEYLGISVPKDGEVVDKTDKKMVIRWWNYYLL